MSFQTLVYALIALAILADLYQVVRVAWPEYVKGGEPEVGWISYLSTFTHKGIWKEFYSHRIFQYSRGELRFPVNRFKRYLVYILITLFLLLLSLRTFPVRIKNRFRRYWRKWPERTYAAIGFVILVSSAWYYSSHSRLTFSTIDWLGKIITGLEGLWLAGLVIWFTRLLIWDIVRLPFKGIRSLYRAIRPLPPPPPKHPFGKPVICKRTRDRVTFITTKEIYEESLRWHREAVLQGHRAPSEKIVMRGFLYYDPSVLVGQKGRTPLSGLLAWFEKDIKPNVWIEEHDDIYVPFASENKGRFEWDIEVFKPEFRQMHTEAMLEILGWHYQQPSPAQMLREAEKTVAK